MRGEYACERSTPAAGVCQERYTAKRLERPSEMELGDLTALIDPLPTPLQGLDAKSMARMIVSYRPRGASPLDTSHKLLEDTLPDADEKVQEFLLRRDLRSLRVALTHGNGSSTQLFHVKWLLNSGVSLNIF